MQVLSEIAKICHIKKLKAITWQIKFFQLFIIKPVRTFPGHSVWKDVNNEIQNSKKNWTNVHVLSKNAKIRDGKMLKPFHYH